MRPIRRLLLTAALGFVVSLGLAGPAAAQEEEEVDVSELSEEEIELIIHEAELLAEENGGDEFTAHCIEILVEGGAIDDCQEAPNPLLPEVNEIIWGGIGFAVVFGFLMWKGFPAIKSSMNERTERIRSDLEGAESARTEAETVLEDYKAQLADARAEAGRIIEEARQAADTMKRDQEARLQTELADMRDRAQADIEASKSQAMTDLRDDVAELAIGAAEAVVQRSLDRETQVQLIETYINQVGQRS